MGIENPKESVSIDRSKEIKKKLFKATSEVLKKAGFKRHRTKQSAWWRQNGDVIQGFHFQRSQFSHNYMVNLTTHKANNIDDIDTYHFEMGDRMDGLFNDGDNHEGRVHIDRLLDFGDLPEGNTQEDQQIQEFIQILEGFIPLYFDTPERTEENRQSIRDLLLK